MIIIGWPICANQVGLEGIIPVKFGSCFKPCPGYNLQVLDEQHRPKPAGELGTLAIKLPLPPGALLTIYNSAERYKESYMANIPGYYDTGDAGIIDSDGYVHVMSRTDDVINVAGHRLSTGAMEEVCAQLIL
jgi:propionyl-CoA synthetase